MQHSTNRLTRVQDPADVAAAIRAANWVALFCAVVWASMIGAIMPILFNRLSIDPAVAAGPLVTTLNDGFSLLIYFGLSLLLVKVVGLG